MVDGNPDTITTLQERILFLEDTVDALNTEVVRLSKEMELAKSAMQLLSKKVEQVDSQSWGAATNEKPPHY